MQIDKLFAVTLSLSDHIEILRTGIDFSRKSLHEQNSLISSHSVYFSQPFHEPIWNSSDRYHICMREMFMPLDPILNMAFDVY